MTPETITLDAMNKLQTELNEAVWEIAAVISLSEQGIYSPTMAAQRVNQIVDNVRAAAQ